MEAYVALTLLAVLAVFLVSAGIEDVRDRNIANWKNAAIALLAPLWWWANGVDLWPDAALQFGIALAVFCVFIGVYALNMMGGGDVKMIGALALWLPPQPLVWMLIVMSLVGGGITLAMVVEKMWRRSETPIEVPYGVAIAIATLLIIREPIINHLG